MSHEKSTLDQLRIQRTSLPERSRSPWPWLGAAAFLLITALVVWWMLRPGVLEVTTASAREVSSGSQRTLLNASGYVTARREATVSSKFTGKVIEVMVEEGMKVEAGQVLARLDASNVEASLKLAEAQLIAAQSALNETKVRQTEADRELKRVHLLADEKIATTADLDRAEASLNSLNARFEQQTAQAAVAEREVALWQQQRDDTIVRAPFAGVVTAKNAQPGEMISPMSAGGSFTRTGICTIVDMASLEIEVDVNESYINRVEPGQIVQATLDSYPEWRIPSKVIAIIPTADRQKATVKVRVAFEKLDPRILPHMGVKVAFQASDAGGEASRREIVIPKAALYSGNGTDVAWVIQGGRVERRAIKVSATRNEEVTVSAGISPGEKVILDAPADLTEGARVSEKSQ